MAGTNDSLTFSSRLAEDDPASRYWRPLLTDPNGEFARRYNCESFGFDHGLKGHPLFELDSLIALARRLATHPDPAYWSNGGVKVSDPWEKGMFQTQSLPGTLEDILHNNSILIMRHTDQDPIYAPVLQKLLADFVAFVGAPLRDDVIHGDAMILVASPNRITPYHFDDGTNYLLQIAGDKVLHVWDEHRGRVVSDEERDLYFSGHPSAARYTQNAQATATAYDLKPGQGVHIPPLAPHWAQNGNGLSIALSLSYQLKSIKSRARIHWLNHRIRKLGLRPSPFGASPTTDAIKGWTTDRVQAARGLFRPKAPTRDWPVWKPD